jgi:sporulation protein YlmC with PRC-barrel domain
MSQSVDLALGILDHQLLDSEGRRCGNVDDLELEGVRAGAPRVEAILAGPPVWRGRGAMGRLAAALARGRTVRVPWSEVEKVDSGVRLKQPAETYGLGRGDTRARKLVAWIPGAER